MSLLQLMRVSDALDSGKTGSIRLAVENLALDDYDLSRYRESLLTILLRFSSFDLVERHEDAKHITGVLLSKIHGSSLREECVRLICGQSPVCSTIAAKVFMSENLKLPEDECNILFNRLYSHELSNITDPSEWMERIAMSCRILRKSDFSINHTKKLFMESLETVFPQIHGVSKSGKFSQFPSELLTELMEFAPGHPILEIEDSAGTSSEHCFVPRVQSVEFRLGNAIRGFSDVLSSNGIYNDEDAYSYFTIFEYITRNVSCLQIQKHHITVLAKFWKCAFRLTNGVDLSTTQRMINFFKLSIELMNAENRALFLKRLLREISQINSFAIGYEPQLTALVIDTYRRDIRVPEFQKELGEFWTIVYSLKYDNIYNSTAFYSALFMLAKTQALFRINKGLCRVILSTILKPLHVQIVDFKKMKSVESNRGIHQSELNNQEDLGSELFEMIVFSYEDACASIEIFLNE